MGTERYGVLKSARTIGVERAHRVLIHRGTPAELHRVGFVLVLCAIPR